MTRNLRDDSDEREYEDMPELLPVDDDNDNDGDEDDGDDDDDDDGNGVQAMGGGGDDVRSLALEMELMRVVSKLLDDDSSGEDGSTSEVCPILSALILSSMRIT